MGSELLESWNLALKFLVNTKSLAEIYQILSLIQMAWVEKNLIENVVQALAKYSQGRLADFAPN